jgi:hypothetical protein
LSTKTHVEVCFCRNPQLELYLVNDDKKTSTNTNDLKQLLSEDLPRSKIPAEQHDLFVQDAEVTLPEVPINKNAPESSSTSNNEPE